MPWMPDLRHRVLEPEIMDQEGLDPSAHAWALSGLRRLHWFSGAVNSTWAAVRRIVRQREAEDAVGPTWVLDIATGDGELLLGLAARAARAGIRLELAGCDRSATAVDLARQRAEASDVPARYFEADVLVDRLPEEYDILTCSLFLHHLAEDQAIDLLRAMRGAARCGAVITDLARSRLAWSLVYLGSRTLTRSPIVRVDALRSVAAAFTVLEAADLAARAGWRDIEVVSHSGTGLRLTGGPR